MTSTAPLQPTEQAIFDWVGAADARKKPATGEQRVSGFVTIQDGPVFHVAETTEGPLVSKLQWKPAEDGVFKPVLNLFTVTEDERELAITSWQEKLQLEKTNENVIKSGKVR